MSAVAADTRTIEASKVALPNGVRLNYVHGGPDDGPAVVLLHGLSDSAFSFSRVVLQLPPHLRFIAVDQRGHGNSDRPARGYSMDDFADDALQLMDTLGLKDATVVGHSMGSFVARRMAERAPHRVSRLIVIGTALTPKNVAVSELITVVNALSDPIGEEFIREFQLSCINQPVPDEFMARVIDESRKVPVRVWRAALAGLWAYEPVRPLMVPTMILGGDRDAVFSAAEQYALYRETPDSVLCLEPGVGHTIHWEAPDRFIELAFGR